MDQLIYASLSHTHYWYEVGMLKVQASDLYIPNLLLHIYFTIAFKTVHLVIIVDLLYRSN